MPRRRPDSGKSLSVSWRSPAWALDHRRTWLVLANPRPGRFGVIALADPARTATETDLAVPIRRDRAERGKLSRLQSVAEADWRSHPDFAEELLAGADEATVKASAHVLGYDPERPHRVIIATGRARDGLDEQFFQAVVREVRRPRPVATLVVGRANYVVVIADREVDWAEAAGGHHQRAAGRHVPAVAAVDLRYPQAATASRRKLPRGTVRGAARPRPWSAISAVPVLLFDSLGVYRKPSLVTDPAGIEAFTSKSSRHAADYDKRHHLRPSPSRSRSTSTAAATSTRRQQRCPVHRNTLKDRFEASPASRSVRT